MFIKIKLKQYDSKAKGKITYRDWLDIEDEGTEIN